MIDLITYTLVILLGGIGGYYLWSFIEYAYFIIKELKND